MRLTRAEDGDLLRAAARGDDRAFAEFYRRWLPLVTGYHLRRTRSRELAFDLTAETFAAVVADLQRFDRDRGSPAGWLFEIAEHKLLDSRRRAKVESSARRRLGHEPIVLDDRDLERVHELASFSDSQRLERLLAQLPDRNEMPFARGSLGRWKVRLSSEAPAFVRIAADGARHELLEHAHELQRAVECELPIVESHCADEPLVDVTSHFHLKLDCHR